MAKIHLQEIIDTLSKQGWKVLSKEYSNLDTEMEFECNEGHKVISTWKALRNKIECPICKSNIYKNAETKVVPKKRGEKRILALDQATNVSGYAIYDNENLVKYGTFSTSKNEQEEKLSEIRSWLINMINIWNPDFVALEGIQLQENLQGGQRMGVTTFEALARLQGALMVTCYEMGVQFKIYPTNTWRNGNGVKGRSRSEKKRSMQNLAKQWYDVTISEDEADAVGIGRYASKDYNKPVKIMNWEQ